MSFNYPEWPHLGLPPPPAHALAQELYLSSGPSYIVQECPSPALSTTVPAWSWLTTCYGHQGTPSHLLRSGTLGERVMVGEGMASPSITLCSWLGPPGRAAPLLLPATSPLLGELSL